MLFRSTPLLPKQAFLPENEPSPPPSRGRDAVKSKRSKLDIFRSDESAKGQKHGSESGNTGKRRGKQAAEDVPSRTASRSPMPASPGVRRSPFPQRNNDSIGSVNTPEYRKDYKEPREPSSAVSRFLKGVKSEGSKVGEFIFRRDRPAEDSDSSSESDYQMPERSEPGNSGNTEELWDDGRGAGAATTGNSSKTTGQYHVALPTFRSQNDIDDASGRTDDPVSSQVRARANSRSPRFDSLAPPRIDVEYFSTASSPNHSRAPTPEPPSDRARSDERRVGTESPV